MKSALLPQLRNQLGIAIASKAMVVAMVFLFGYLMSVEEYGVLNLYLSCLWIFGITMTLNLHTAVGRAIYRDGAQFPGFLGSTLVALCTIYLACAAVVLWQLEWFARVLGLPPQAVVIALVVVFATVLESMVTQVTIAEHRSGMLFVILASKAIGVLALSVALLLVYENERYLGVLHAELVCAIVLIGFFLAWLGRRARWRPAWEDLRYMTAYSVPLIPYMLSLTLLSQFDRVQIDRLFGNAETGLYSLAYNFGMLFVVLTTVILNASTVAFFASMNRSDHAKVVADARAIGAVMMLLAAGVVLFGEPVAGVIAPAQYREALALIAPVAVGGFCLAMFQAWVRILAHAHVTWLISIIAVFGTVLKLGLNEWWLPVLGYAAAALTTVLAYAAMAMLCLVCANRYLAGARLSIGGAAAQIIVLGVLAALGWCSTLPPAADLVWRGVALVALAYLLRRELLEFRHLNRAAASAPAFSAVA